MSVDATRSTWLLTKKQVTPTQKFILLALADRAGEDGECWPSVKRIVTDTGYDRETVIANRLQLIEMGLIELTGRMFGRTKQIPEMKLIYINRREGKSTNESQEETNSRQTPTVTNLNSRQTPTVKQSAIADTEPKSLLNLKDTAAGAAFSAASLPLSPITPVELIAVYHEVLPDNPRVLINPVTGAIESKVKEAIREFKKYWFRRAGSPITIDDFKTYMMDLRNNCSRFTLDSYIGKGGNEQKNGLITFLKWETVENVNANKNLY